MTVPHEDFIAKINAVRYAFLELGVEDGVILARTDSLGAGLTQKIPVSKVSLVLLLPLSFTSHLK